MGKGSETLAAATSWKKQARRNDKGYYDLETDDLGGVPVRLFLTPRLLHEAEDILYRQIVNATRFPGVKLVAITPDSHYGYGVPVGCVILTDARWGAVARRGNSSSTRQSALTGGGLRRPQPCRLRWSTRPG